MNAFLLALSFLTRIPVYKTLQTDAAQLGASVTWYPVVGLILGIFSVLFFYALTFLHFSSFVIAVLLLVMLVLLTGALHWDGLADCADAWLCGGDREKTLQVLKDTHCGAGAIIVVGVFLLLQCALLEAVVWKHQIAVLLIAPVVSRAMGVLLLLTTPYVRQEGLGSMLNQHLSRMPCRLVLWLVVGVLIFVFRLNAVVVIIGLGILFFIMRGLMLKRIGGITGDTIGAFIVLSEIAVLLLALVDITIYA